MKALILDADACTASMQDVPKPVPGPAEILVAVQAVALNPIDPLYVAHPLGATGRVIGSDFAGIVSEVGLDLPCDSPIRVGSRVAGFLQGACSVNPRPGAFAEYLLVPWDLVWKVPDGVELEAAAGVSLVALTAAQSIWYRLGLPAPFSYRKQPVGSGKTNNEAHEEADRPLNVFIYGASTSVGLYAAQMVHLSSRASGQTMKLFGAASKSRWSLLQSPPYSYTELVDYRDPEWPKQVRGTVGQAGIDLAYDGISEGESVQKVASLLKPDGELAIVRSRQGGAWSASNLTSEPIYGAVWEGLGEEVRYQGFTVAKSPEAREFAVQFYKWLSEAVGSDLLPVSARLMPGALDRIVRDGFALLGSGDMTDRSMKRAEDWMKPISAEKLVYRL